MTVKEFKQQLSEFPDDMEIGGIVVSYTEHNCGGDGYCYCSNEDHTYTSMSIEREFEKKKKQNVIKRLWIRGDY